MPNASATSLASRSSPRKKVRPASEGSSSRKKCCVSRSNSQLRDRIQPRSRSVRCTLFAFRGSSLSSSFATSKKRIPPAIGESAGGWTWSAPADSVLLYNNICRRKQRRGGKRRPDAAMRAPFEKPPPPTDLWRRPTA
eukprot:scaffold2449_cov79-Isochrysis_galbana.AAC.3